MFKKDYKAIDEAIDMERESGHLFCDFDDYQHDLQEIADMIGVEMVEDEEENFVFKNAKDEARVKEALNYYYEQHN